MEIVILTVNSKEIIDLISEYNGKEVKIGNKSYYIIKTGTDAYYVWNDFTDNNMDNDEYLYHFRIHCVNNRNYDKFLFYKPEKMLKYELIYKNQPICKIENITNSHYQKVKNTVLDIFKDNSFVNNSEKLIKIENSSKYNVLEKLTGEIYEFNFINKNFIDKFENNLCIIS